MPCSHALLTRICSHASPHTFDATLTRKCPHVRVRGRGSTGEEALITRIHKTHKIHTHTQAVQNAAVSAASDTRVQQAAITAVQSNPSLAVSLSLSFSLLRPPSPPQLASCPVTARKAEGVLGEWYGALGKWRTCACLLSHPRVKRKRGRE
jgi:hypothetical protein